MIVFLFKNLVQIALRNRYIKLKDNFKDCSLFKSASDCKDVDFIDICQWIPATAISKVGKCDNVKKNNAKAVFDDRINKANQLIEINRQKIRQYYNENPDKLKGMLKKEKKEKSSSDTSKAVWFNEYMNDKFSYPLEPLTEEEENERVARLNKIKEDRLKNKQQLQYEEMLDMMEEEQNEREGQGIIIT